MPKKQQSPSSAIAKGVYPSSNAWKKMDGKWSYLGAANKATQKELKQVLNARSAPPGYHDGMVGDKRGFFPKDCVEEVKLRRPLPDTGQRATNENLNGNRDSGKFKGSIKKQNTSSSSDTPHGSMPDSISLVSFDSYEDGHSGSTGRTSSVRSDDMAQLQSTSTPGVYHNTRSVALWRGSDGFGFILRGAKSEGPVHDFVPSAKIPGLQYLESVEHGSHAHNAGLRSGDFILKIGDADVRRYGHQQLVDRIRACGEPLHIQVTTVIHNAQNGDSASVHSNQLDNVLAMEDSAADHAEKTASVRRVPGRKVAGEQLQNLFRQNSTAEAIATLPRSPQHSTFSSAKKPLRVLPPSLSNTGTFQYENADPHSQHEEMTRSTRSFSSASAGTYTTWGRGTGPPPLQVNKDFRSHSVSGATGERLLMQSGAKSKKMPPPPPKRVDSRLSVSIPEESHAVRSPPSFTPSTVSTSTQPQPSANANTNTQSDMAAAIALAARNRAERRSQSEEQKKQRPPSPPPPEEPAIEDTPTKSVAEISSALSIALAAKQKILSQQKTPGKTKSEVKKPSGSFVVNPAKFSVQRHDERHVLPPPPPSTTNLPPPPPPSDYDDVTGMALPPPPAFPAPDPHHTQFNHMTFDELLNLPPPPSDLLPSPQETRPVSKFSEKSKPTSLGFLPPPPIPPPDDDDGCTSPNGADNLSNADSGVADVAGDGFNLSHHHRNTLSDHHSHDHVSGDNHSTVSSLSTTSTMSSEDAGTDFSAPERMWPLREIRNSSTEDNAPKGSPPPSQAGNMYLDILKKAKNKQQAPNPSTPATTSDSKNLRPGITVTKMTFAPVTALPPPVEASAQKTTKTASVFPPAPKEYSTIETKPLFGKATPGGGIQTKKVGFTPKAAPTPVVKPAAEKIAIKTTPVIAPSAPKTTVNPAASANNNESPVKKAPSGGGGSTAKKPLAQWSVAEVCDWLKELGLDMYASSFEENEISGEHLPDLGKDELIELGVKPFGHRLTIDRSIKKLVGT